MSTVRGGAELVLITRTIKTSNQELRSKKKRYLQNPLFLVNIGNPSGRWSLRPTLCSLEKSQAAAEINSSGKIDILVTGTLQRYLFWDFTKNLKDDELQGLLSDAPVELEIQALVTYLARKFYPYARSIEQAYIKENVELFENDKTMLLSPNFVAWEKVIPVVEMYGASVELSEFFSEYQASYNYFLDEYWRQPAIQQIYTNTCKTMLISQQTLIEKQLTRLVNANINFRNLTKHDLAALAHVCCLRYLFEGSPLMATGLVNLGYSAIFSHEVSNEAFKAARQLLLPPTKIMTWVTVPPANQSTSRVMKTLSINTAPSSSNSSLASSSQAPAARNVLVRQFSSSTLGIIEESKEEYTPNRSSPTCSPRA